MTDKVVVCVTLLLLLTAGPTGCAPLSPEATPAPPADAAVTTVSESVLASPLDTPTPVPAPPTVTPAPTFAPYEGASFTIVFTRRYTQLWLSEIGGEGERLLVEVGEGETIADYSPSPDGHSIAYIVGAAGAGVDWGDRLNLLDVATGDIREVARAEEGRPLFTSGWCGPEQVTYHVMSPDAPLAARQPESFVRVDLATGERTEESSNTTKTCSPDGRFLVSGLYRWGTFDMSGRKDIVPYELVDLGSGESWVVTETDDNAEFESCSPDRGANHGGAGNGDSGSGGGRPP